MCTCARPYGRARRCSFGGQGVTWAHRGRSVIEGAVPEVRGLFLDGSSQPRGWSARCLRIVRLVQC
jgi:hypothetical protein